MVVVFVVVGIHVLFLNPNPKMASQVAFEVCENDFLDVGAVGAVSAFEDESMSGVDDMNDMNEQELLTALEMAQVVAESPLEVAYSVSLEDFKRMIVEVNNSVTFFYQRPLALKQKAYERLYGLLRHCEAVVDDLSSAFTKTEQHIQEVIYGAQELIFAFGGLCLNGSALIVLEQKKKLEAELLYFEERKGNFFSFVHEDLYPFLELVGGIVSDRSGFITLGYLLRFVTEALQVVRNLEASSNCLHKLLFRTTQAMDYSIKKYRDGDGAHLDTSDSETEPEDALDIPLVRKKPRFG